MNPLIQKLRNQSQNYFSFTNLDLKNNVLIKSQNGIIRTSCIDSLDRTNIAQYKIALTALANIFNVIEQTERSSISQHKESYSIFKGVFFEKFLFLFDKNGKELCMQYTAGSKPQLLLRQKQKKNKGNNGGWFGAFSKMRKGVEKYFNGSSEERLHHECVKFFLAQHPLSKLYGLKASLEQQLHNKHQEYLKKEELSLLVFTWNCAGNEPNS